MVGPKFPTFQIFLIGSMYVISGRFRQKLKLSIYEIKENIQVTFIKYGSFFFFVLTHVGGI